MTSFALARTTFSRGLRHSCLFIRYGRTFTISLLDAARITLLDHLSNPKLGHTAGRSGRGDAQRGGWARRGWVGQDAVGSIRPGDNPPSCPPANREHCPELLFESTNNLIRIYLSNPKPGHTTGGSGRSARRSGQAGSGKIECQQNYSPRKQKTTVPSKASKKRRFNVSPKARTSEFLCKPTEEQNQRLTIGLSAVYHPDEKRSLFLAAKRWNDAFLSL